MRPEQRRCDHHVSIRINKKVFDLPLTPIEPCIFKVQHPLRKVNEAAFDPEIVAIGPYHRGKDNLQSMEQHKLCYLQQFLKRENESSVERYIKALRELEEPARKCYAEPVSLSSDEFVEMMLLDGCFIIELFRKMEREKLRDEHDRVFKFSTHYIWRDLLLFENQLPFLVLSKLISMTKFVNFTSIATHILSRIVYGPNIHNFSRNSNDDPKHLLDLTHNCLFPSSAEKEAVENITGQKLSFMRWAMGFKEASVKFKRIEGGQKLSFMRCAMDLKEASVKFKRIEGGSLLNIKFDNGVMEIPNLSITDRTESVFRNLVAYEQYCVDTDTHYVSEYVSFMDCLINSPKDVELLGRLGIIDNWLGDDEEVSTMFNKLCKNVTVANLCYSAIYNNVNMHCGKRRNVWKAKLEHNYFNSPWALISFVAATFLLLFTMLQTIFTIIH